MSPPPGKHDPAKPVSVKQFELAEAWLAHLREKGGRMPAEMRRQFFELFWEEQLEREAEGRQLRIPTGFDVAETYLLGAEPL